jgi:cytochrome b561
VLLIVIPVLGLSAVVPRGPDRTLAREVCFFTLFPLVFRPNRGTWTLAAHAIASTIANLLIAAPVIAALRHPHWNKDGLLRGTVPHGERQELPLPCHVVTL